MRTQTPYSLYECVRQKCDRISISCFHLFTSLNCIFIISGQIEIIVMHRKNITVWCWAIIVCWFSVNSVKIIYVENILNEINALEMHIGCIYQVLHHAHFGSVRAHYTFHKPRCILSIRCIFCIRFYILAIRQIKFKWVEWITKKRDINDALHFISLQFFFHAVCQWSRSGSVSIYFPFKCVYMIFLNENKLQTQM